jgi:hypothetical protein
MNSDVENKLTKKFNFTYKSKCTDFDNAMKQMKLFQTNLQREEVLNVLFLKAKQTPSDTHTNIDYILIRVK